MFVGDRGYNVSAEVRYPIPGLKYVSPWLAQRIQGAAFFDLGQAWLDDSNVAFIPGISHSSARTLLMGAGAGVRLQMTRFLTGFTDFGFGLTPQGALEPNAMPTMRVHFGVRSDLLPKNYKTRGDETVPLDKAKRKAYKKAMKEAKKEKKRLAKLAKKQKKQLQAEAKQQQVDEQFNKETLSHTPTVTPAIKQSTVTKQLSVQPKKKPVVNLEKKTAFRAKAKAQPVELEMPDLNTSLLPEGIEDSKEVRYATLNLG